MATKSEEIAWAAGLFEGEGWFSLDAGQPIMGMQMSDYEVLERFASVVKLGKIYYRKPRVYSYERINARKEQWAWRLSKKDDILHLIKLFRPWLGSRRIARAEELIEAASKLAPRPGMPKGKKTKRAAPCGEIRCYWQGCRCKECKAANRRYLIDLAERKKKQLVVMQP